MKIRNRLIIFFSVLVVVSIGVTSYFTLEFILSSVIEQEIEEMKRILFEREVRIETLHARASEDIVFALKNLLFVEYFELPETKAGNVYKNGVLQFTESQRKIKMELEEWIWNFQNKFDVDETCLIDTTGQEHTRLVLKRIESDEYLSPDEKESPFFEPSFKKNLNEVHIQYPYFSPDTHRWVFAYTSPIVLGETKPAIYHFEMPITIFQDIVNIEHGRMYVVDPQGIIIADSQYDFSKNVSDNFEEQFPSVSMISDSPEFDKLLQKMKIVEQGIGRYSANGDIHYVVFMKMPTFGWTLVYEESESLMLSENSSVFGNIEMTIIAITLLIIIFALIGTLLISNRITSPIIKLRDFTNEIANGHLDTKINLEGNDELYELSRSFNTMVASIKKKIEIEKELSTTKAELKNNKLTTIGNLAARMAHDLRNPLSLLKTTHELTKLRHPPHSVDEKTKRHYKMMDEAISKMAHQLDNVMDFVRIKSLKIENTSLNEILDSAIGSLKIPQNIRIDKKRNLDVNIQCDREAIEIVFTNLLLNSVQAIGKKDGTITIRIKESTENISIEFEDNGTGIPDDNIHKIFDPLFTTKSFGTGLGLSSCKSIIEQHEGMLSVRNNPTVFTIMLPK